MCHHMATRVAIFTWIVVLTGNGTVTAGDSETAAERGRALLTGKSFIGPSWSESAFTKAREFWGHDAPDPAQSPEAYAAAFASRYGLHPAPYPNDGLPMGLRKATSADGKRKGIQIDCMVCHGGSIGGTSYVGLGNSQLDLTTLFRELNLAEGRAFVPIPFTLNTSRGTVNAGQMSIFLLSLRNPDMTLRAFPVSTGASLPELDVPAWWILGKKRTKYYDGRTDARSARSNMQFAMGDQTLDQLKAIEPDFRDIDAYLKSIKAPKYPFPVDADKAHRGEQLFAKNCVRCHGTYGPNGSYPSKIVPLDVIGTDPRRATGITDRFIAHYNSTWFADYKADETLVGYQAPPLDGVWATAPYLHNGSVPTLYHMLKSSERPPRYRRPPSTSFDHYDPVKVGWKAEPVTAPLDPKTPQPEAMFLFDSSRRGLSNKGHTFGDKLSDEERMDVIEYLKTL
ncbi:MAG: cytochrome c peroxidase [Planctomycetota bacterium]|nr:cytochrome c peroxidase [Planctomycetota bacterium]